MRTGIDTPLENLIQEIDVGRARGSNVVVLYGKGEPTLHTGIDSIIDYTARVGMSPVVITNGAVGIKAYKRLYELKLDHLQVSVHGLGETVDKVAERKGAGKKQMRLLQWLHKNNHPFRVNITMQQLNLHQIPEIVRKVVELGAFHISLLNFLPHYKSATEIRAVANNPVDMIGTLEEAMDYMKGKTLFTLRYFPMCLLKPKYWGYVTNARHVLYDPWEYNSGNHADVWKAAVAMGNASGIQGAPCKDCLLFGHCGGWNKTYAQVFNLEGLHAIKEVPGNLKEVVSKRGGLFDLNPSNSKEGIAF